MIRFITMEEARARDGFSRSKQYDLIKAGRYPKPVVVDSRKRIVEHEHDAFLAQLIAERDGEAA